MEKKIKSTEIKPASKFFHPTTKNLVEDIVEDTVFNCANTDVPNIICPPVCNYVEDKEYMSIEELETLYKHIKKELYELESLIKEKLTVDYLFHPENNGDDKNEFFFTSDDEYRDWK